MTNWRYKPSANITPAHFGLVFLFLAAALIVSVTTYWIFVLEPQINEYSTTQSNLIAQSQSWILADELDQDVIREQLLMERMDEILILSDRETEIPYIHGITIESDDISSQSRVISRGRVDCRNCSIIEIPLYAKTNHELVGLATFYSNNDLLNFLRDNIRSKIIISLVLIMLFIAIAWLITWKQINRLRIKDKNLSSVFDTIPFPMIISNNELDKVIYFNHAATKVFDINYDNINTQKPEQFFSDSFDMNHLEMLRAKELLAFECPIVTSNKRESWALATMASIVYNDKPSVIISFVDITETKKAKDEINKSKERFATIFDGLEDAVYVIRDDDKQIMFSNISDGQIDEFESLCDTHCLAKEKLIHGHDGASSDSGYRRRDDVISCDFFNENNGYWYSSRQRIIAWIDGQSVRLVTIADITKLIKVQLDLEKEKDKAEVASRAKSEFLATMSHEIRTPMNGIIGMLNLFKRTSLTEEQSNYLDTINVSSDQLLLLLNDILDISEIESGKLVLENKPFKLSNISDDCIHLIENRAKDKCIELYIDVKPNVPDDLIGDEVRLRQILINLLGNAFKFTEQGSITLNIKVLDMYDGAVDLLFSIIDTGIGIPEAKQQLLFEKFSQLDSSINRKYGGSGLGLAISKKLVEAMGGEIGFENNPDKGATFHFAVRFSLVSEPDIEALVDKTFKDTGCSSLSILLAEDNEINCFAAKSLLEKDGHKVVVAKNGEEAVNAVINSDECFDVILMDIHMPEVDGIEACRRIRALKDTDKQSTPIIALTANIMQDEKQKCIEAGMNAFVTKPFSPERLNSELAAMSNMKCKKEAE